MKVKVEGRRERKMKGEMGEREASILKKRLQKRRKEVDTLALQRRMLAVPPLVSVQVYPVM